MSGLSDKYKRELARNDLKKKVVQLRIAGASYTQIAESLDISLSTAHKYTQQAASEVPAEDVAILRQRESERLDTLQRAQWGKAVQGDAEAARLALSIIDRRIKLFGLDAPQQVEIGVGAVDIAGTARNILAQVNGDMDAEIIDEQDD